MLAPGVWRRRRTPSAATVVYFIAIIAKTTIGPAMPVYAEYAVLVALTIVFVFAGVRDERQAEPWWWPNRRGATRAEKRPTI